MDIRRYPQLKASGTITLTKLKKAYSATIKRFSPDFGTPATDEEAALDLELLKATALELKDAKAAIDMLIDDLKALP